jgi:membrane fusion protein, multidrug efflux system
MALKATYLVTAIAGIAVASGAAWWYQQPKAGTASGTAVTEAPAAGARAGGSASPASAAGSGRPPSVEAAKVDVAKLTDETQAVGSLRSRRGVVVRPEVAGRITQLNFTDGQRVKAGQVLVQFDDQLQQAQVQQSVAEVSIAQANQKRNQELVAQNFVSQRSLDESAANLQVAQAKLTLARATAARLKIISPFDGTAGIRQVNVGDYLKDGADIVNIEDMDAMFVDFRLPERFQSKVKRGQSAQIELDAMPGRKFAAQIQAIDPLIDANGRSVGVRGCIDNRAGQLRPGMFARVNPVFGVRDNARVVPEEAIVPQGGKQYVIKLNKADDGKSQTTQRIEVEVGLRSPGKVEIVEGLEVGDTVVVAGQQRVQKDGTVVSVIDTAGARGGKPGSEPSNGPALAGVTPGASAGAGTGAVVVAAPTVVAAAAAAPAGPSIPAAVAARPASTPASTPAPTPALTTANATPPKGAASAAKAQASGPNPCGPADSSPASSAKKPAK